MGFFDFLKDALSLDSFYTETSATPPSVSGVDADPAATQPVAAVEPPRPTGYVADQPTEPALPALSQRHPDSAATTAEMPAVAGVVQKDLPILDGHGNLDPLIPAPAPRPPEDQGEFGGADLPFLGGPDGETVPSMQVIRPAGYSERPTQVMRAVETPDQERPGVGSVRAAAFARVIGSIARGQATNGRV